MWRGLVRVRRGRSHVNMEKSSKNLISLLSEKAARGLPKPPPHLTVSRIRGVYTRKKRGCRTRTQNPEAELGRGERGNNAKFNNSSTDQHFDTGFYTKIATTFLLLIALTKCAYLLLASLASKNRVLYSGAEPIKGSLS